MNLKRQGEVHIFFITPSKAVKGEGITGENGKGGGEEKWEKSQAVCSIEQMKKEDRGSEEACVENIGDSWKKSLSLWWGHTPLKACEEEEERESELMFGS